MNIIKRPFYWVSAHRDINYTFEYENVFTLTSVVGEDGKAVFIFVSDGIHSLSPGEYLYCESGLYKGYHKVTGLASGFSNWYLTETDYTDTQVGGTIRFIEDHVFEIYAGYSSGPMATYQPYTKVAEFKPEPGLTGTLNVNISGYVNKLFDVINSNDTVEIGALTVYINLFTQVTILIDGAVIATNLVLNSALTALELNRDYVDTGRSLTGGALGNYYPSCGDITFIMIKGGYVSAGDSYSDGVFVPLGPDFSDTDFSASDFKVTG